MTKTPLQFHSTNPVVSQLETDNPETDTVTINVNDGTDAITGATVTIGEDSETTDSEGKATFDLAYDDYSVTVTATGYDDKTESISFRSNHKNFTISLTETTTVTENENLGG